MRDLQQARGLGRIGRAALLRPLHQHPLLAEEQQVQVQLARAVAESILPAEGPLDRLEGEQQRDRAGVRPPGPAGTSRATTALWKSGWSVTSTGAVTYRRETPARLAPGSAARAWTAAVSVARASPTLAPSPMYARTAGMDRLPIWRTAGHDSRPPRRGAPRLDSARAPRCSCSFSTPRPRPGPGRWCARWRRRATRWRSGSGSAFLAAGADAAEVVAGPPDGLIVRRAARGGDAGAERGGRGRGGAGAGSCRESAASPGGLDRPGFGQHPPGAGRRPATLRGGRRGPGRARPREQPLFRRRGGDLAGGGSGRAAATPRRQRPSPMAGGTGRSGRRGSPVALAAGRRHRHAARPDRAGRSGGAGAPRPRDSPRNGATHRRAAGGTRRGAVEPARRAAGRGPRLRGHSPMAGARRRLPRPGPGRGARAPSRVDASPSRAPRPARGRLAPSWASCWTATAPSRWPRTVARLADAAVIDTRVLLAHRHGADESATMPPGLAGGRGSLRLGPACCPSPSPIRGCAPSPHRPPRLPPTTRSCSAATPWSTADCACSRSELVRGLDDARSSASVARAPAAGRPPASGRSFIRASRPTVRPA